MPLTLGVAFIARNEAKNLARLLPLVTPHVDKVIVVDTGSTDATIAVAKQLGAEVHSFEWCDDFAAARNFAFSKLDTSWQGWLDCDDHVLGIEKVREILEDFEAKNPQIKALWCEYRYERMAGDNGPWISVLQRERFVKRGAGFQWVLDVHEHLEASRDTPPAMAFTPDVIVEHHHDPSKGLQRAYRNLRILRAKRRHADVRPKVYFDLGWQYFNGRQWGRALAMFRHYLKLDQDPITRYQALHQMGTLYRILQRVDDAEDFEWQAARAMPEWADAWYGLADCALMRNAPHQALLFIEHGRRCEKPNNLLVLNPLDYDFHPMMTAHKAHALQGNLREALRIVEDCLKIVPKHPEAMYARQAYLAYLRDEDAVQAAVALGHVIPDDQAQGMYDALPLQLQKKKAVRDRFIAPTLLKLPKEDVAIWCGATLESWGPETPRTTGIGGSETAVVEMARRLGERGVNVAVYNQCEEREADYHSFDDGGHVVYLDFQRFDPTIPRKLFIAWRNPTIADIEPKADQAWLWVHDLHHQNVLTEARGAYFDVIRPVSRWHGEYLLWHYPFLAGKIAPTRNGIDLTRFFNEGIERKTNRAVWCSSPDRGLDHLLTMWPEIRRGVPDAELCIFYGFANFIKVMQQQRDPMMQTWYRYVLELSRQPGVVWRDRVNQLDLAKELQAAQVLAYSSNFLETNCITTAEAMAGGAVVLSTLAGAIPETVQGAGILIQGHPMSEAYQKVFVKDCVTLMTKPKEAASWREKGYKRAAELQWDRITDDWVARIEGIAPRVTEEAVA